MPYYVNVPQKPQPPQPQTGIAPLFDFVGPIFVAAVVTAVANKVVDGILG